MNKKVIELLVEKFTEIVNENNLGAEEVTVTATALTPEEAIGNPEDKDYPIIVGKERMMQAEFRGNYGHAFTDRYGNYTGNLKDIASTAPENNFRRAVFISSLNAVMRYLGRVTQTLHCKDSEPRTCSLELAKYIATEYGHPKIALIGFQPRMLEELSKHFEVRVTDMDENNIGTEKFGVTVSSPDATDDNLRWCDLALVTGTTVVNDTIDQFMIEKPVIFYGVTISGTAALLGFKQFCYCSH